MDKEKTYLISDASKQVAVENHVLRYWEDELKLPVKRNELGHRYYTEEDIEEFRKIKVLKEQGLQLKAIRMIIKNGKLISSYQEFQGEKQQNTSIASPPLNREEKSLRLQNLLKQMMTEVVEDATDRLYHQLAGDLMKELDYQFRMQEERDEEHYRQLDMLLRGKQTRKKKGFFKREKNMIKDKKRLSPS